MFLTKAGQLVKGKKTFGTLKELKIRILEYCCCRGAFSDESMEWLQEEDCFDRYKTKIKCFYNHEDSLTLWNSIIVFFVLHLDTRESKVTQVNKS